MKKRRKLTILGLSNLLVLAICLPLKLDNKGIEPVFAASYPTATLPTEIDLNTTSEGDIRTYYQTLATLPEEEKQGTNLLKNLKPILKNNQEYWKYDSSNNHWKMYEITDRDWEKSPASEISTYNPDTKIITNYRYQADPMNVYVRALYDDRNMDNLTVAGIHQYDPHAINREHVWPKSHGFNEHSMAGAPGDPMALLPGNEKVNSATHSNHYYGFVDKTKTFSYPTGTEYEHVRNNYSGISRTLGGTDTVFEPQDSDKGDIARIIFYMVARYNFYSGEDSEGINSANPNLELIQSQVSPKLGFQSSETVKGQMGILSDLLAWHNLDPVDEHEIRRNDILFKNYTKNRNPFVDFPSWANYIWGSADDDGTNFNPTPTGFADPTTDNINEFTEGGGGEAVPVDGVSLNKHNLELEEGESETLVATVTPTYATNKGVVWSSSNESVATVNNGLVQAIGEGETTITVRTLDGNKTDTCTVIVTAASTVITDEAYRQVLFGPEYNEKGVNNYTNAWYTQNSLNLDNEDFRVDIENANNYSNNWNSVRIGRSANPSIATFTTHDKLSAPIKNITIDMEVRVADPKINSAKLYISPVDDFSTNVSEVNINVPSAEGVSTIDLPVPVHENDLFYKLVFDFPAAGSNGILEIINIKFFEYITATKFSQVLLSNIACDATGATQPNFLNGTSWSKFKQYYEMLDAAEQNELRMATANSSGTAIEQAMARYDYIVAKYGADNYEDFIGRNPAPLAARINQNMLFNVNYLLLLIVLIPAAVYIATHVYKSKKAK